MAKSAWYDMGMRGRRLEAIFRQCNTLFYTNIEKNPELAIAYLDRLLKVEHAITPYADQMTGLKKLLKEGNKKEISIESLR